jgi:hypothetical protein
MDSRKRICGARASFFRGEQVTAKGLSFVALFFAIPRKSNDATFYGVVN